MIGNQEEATLKGALSWLVDETTELKDKMDIVMSFIQGFKESQSSNTQLVNSTMKVDVKDPVVYTDITGDIRPFDEVKAEGFIDLKSLDYLIIKTYDGRFLKVWKKYFSEKEWAEAQDSAARIGKGWRCPTRHDCIDIYDARFKGLDEAMEEIEGEPLKENYWTSESDSDPHFNAKWAVCFQGCMGNLTTSNKYTHILVRPVYEMNL